MNYYDITAILSLAAMALLAVWVLSINYKNKLFYSYALIYLSVVFWVIFYFLWQKSTSYARAYLYLQLLISGAIFMPIFLLHFILNYLEILNKNRSRLLLAYLGGIFFVFIVYARLLFGGLRPKMSFHFWPDAGSYLPAFLFFFFLVTAYSLYLLLSDYKNVKTRADRKKRDIYLLAGILIALAAGSTNFALCYNVKLPPVFNFLFVVYLGLVAYAIFRHRLTEIEVVIKKTIVFAGLFLIIALVYSGPLFIFNILSRQHPEIGRGLAAALSVIFVMVGYERMKLLLIEITDQHLFQKKYEYRKALGELVKETTRPMKLDTFTKILNRNVVRVIKLSGSSAMVLDKIKQQYVFLAASGSQEGNLGKTLPGDSLLIAELGKRDYLLLEDLEEDLQQGQITFPEQETTKKILEILKELNAVLCVPSRFEKEIVGLLLLDEKTSHESYSEEDLDLFVTISRQIALTINNSYLYEESLGRERELARRELEKQTEKIRRLASLGELASGVAHEIRNPMTVLRSRAEDLKNEIDNKEYLLEFADLTVKHIDRILNIVNNMLRFAKEREKAAFQDISVNDVLNDVLTLMSGKLKSKSIELVKNFESRKKVLGDAGALQQAFLNTVLNSFDFMGADGRLTINTYDREKQVVAEIIDNGCGIPKDIIDHIFDPFFTTRVEGAGLGLSITHRIIQDLGGRIMAESEPGQGTKIIMIMPAE